VVDAATKVAERIRARAAMMLNEQEGKPAVKAAEIELGERLAKAPDGRNVTMEEIALHSLHHKKQE
jgi:hypothetical protein